MTPITERLAEALREIAEYVAVNEMSVAPQLPSAPYKMKIIARTALAEYDRLRTHPAEGSEGRDYEATLACPRCGRRRTTGAGRLPDWPACCNLVCHCTCHNDPLYCRECKNCDCHKAAPPPQPVAPERGEAKAVAWQVSYFDKVENAWSDHWTECTERQFHLMNEEHYRDKVRTRALYATQNEADALRDMSEADWRETVIADYEKQITELQDQLATCRANFQHEISDAPQPPPPQPEAPEVDARDTGDEETSGGRYPFDDMGNKIDHEAGDRTKNFLREIGVAPSQLLPVAPERGEAKAVTTCRICGKSSPRMTVCDSCDESSGPWGGTAVPRDLPNEHKAVEGAQREAVAWRSRYTMEAGRLSDWHYVDKFVPVASPSTGYEVEALYTAPPPPDRVQPERVEAVPGDDDFVAPPPSEWSKAGQRRLMEALEAAPPTDATDRVEAVECDYCGGSGFINVLDEDGEPVLDFCDAPAHDTPNDASVVTEAAVQALKDSLWSSWGASRQTTDWPNMQQLRAALEAADRARKPGYRQVTREDALEAMNHFNLNQFDSFDLLAALQHIGAVIPEHAPGGAGVKE